MPARSLKRCENDEAKAFPAEVASQAEAVGTAKDIKAAREAFKPAERVVDQIPSRQLKD